jgi:hypothetical protein
MRTRNKAFLSCAFLGGVLLMATGAMAQTPTSCYAGTYFVETAGPSTVSCNGATCTEITYDVSGGKPDHVAAVVASGDTDCAEKSIKSVTGTNLSGHQNYFPGEGEPITGLGKWSCHDEAVKVNPNGSVSSFTITVYGARGPAPKSVVTKKGNKVGSCEILGIGEDGAASAAPVTETLTHGECSVVFTLNSLTGSVINAELSDDSPSGCQFFDNPVSELELALDGESLGTAQFGDGYVQSGTASCTTRVVGGRVYTWGKPCP